MSDLHRRRLRGNTLQISDYYEAAIAAGSIVTAIPIGRDWRVKAISPDGKTLLLGRFGGRLSALGAGALFAARTGGQIAP